MTVEIRTIGTLLVANRGEIARRIFRTAHAMGIRTVAIYSDADADMPFVRDADRAYRVGPAASAESYLKIEAILEIAKRAEVDAIHPGYGFLAENAAFARAVNEAGMIFIGPTPEAIDAMGLKREAKATVSAAGVPVVPGYDGADQSALVAEAKKVGYPLLLKASAGGGGKGMKRVDREADLQAAIASAKRESLQAFGDDTLLVEKYVENPRHVEIQIFGDAHGNVIHLNERECSIQRRHQKVLEESPSMALSPELRAAMGEAAVKVAQSIGYRNAGTVEFILGADGQFFFLEVNTRLQVEHPVTELVTGLDLVREQIRVAEGHPLSIAQADVRQDGSALEARIYAEDPDHGFLPQSGTLLDWHIEGDVRVDSGIEAGSEIGIHYDPMLAKLITHGADREEATRKMLRALRSLSVQGIRNNREFLIRVLEHPAYRRGEIDTHFLERHPVPAEPADPRPAAIVAALFQHERRRAERKVLPSVPSGFRNNPRRGQDVTFVLDDTPIEVVYTHDARAPGRFDVRTTHAETERSSEARIVEHGDAHLVAIIDGERIRARVIEHGDAIYVHLPGSGRSFAFAIAPRFPDASAAIPTGGCIAPMPGRVVQIQAAEGDRVTRGQVLLVMEAMKMEHTVTAPHDGTVRQIAVREGDQVEADALLAVVDADADDC